MCTRTYSLRTQFFSACPFGAGIAFDRVDSSTIQGLYEHLKENVATFKYTIVPSLSHISGLIESKHLVVYVLRKGDSIINVYAFRNHDILKHRASGIHLCCSILADPSDELLNYNGICSILSEVGRVYPNVHIENTSHNDVLLRCIMEQKHIPSLPDIYSMVLPTQQPDTTYQVFGRVACCINGSYLEYLPVFTNESKTKMTNTPKNVYRMSSSAT